MCFFNLTFRLYFPSAEREHWRDVLYIACMFLLQKENTGETFFIQPVCSFRRKRTLERRSLYSLYVPSAEREHWRDILYIACMFLPQEENTGETFFIQPVCSFRRKRTMERRSLYSLYVPSAEREHWRDVPGDFTEHVSRVFFRTRPAFAPSHSSSHSHSASCTHEMGGVHDLPSRDVHTGQYCTVRGKIFSINTLLL